MASKEIVEVVLVDGNQQQSYEGDEEADVGHEYHAQPCPATVLGMDELGQLQEGGG